MTIQFCLFVFSSSLQYTCTISIKINAVGNQLLWATYSICSVHFSHSVVSDSLWAHGLQHARLPCHHQLPELAQTDVHWVGDAIQQSHPLPSPFSSHLQSFPIWGPFQMSQFFTSGGQSIGVSASTLVLPMNTQDWSPLGWTGWISLQSKGLSRVLSNATVQKTQFLGTQLSL